jgi:hypothetical protein
MDIGPQPCFLNNAYFYWHHGHWWLNPHTDHYFQSPSFFEWYRSRFNTVYQGPSMGPHFNLVAPQQYQTMPTQYQPTYVYAPTMASMMPMAPMMTMNYASMNSNGYTNPIVIHHDTGHGMNHYGMHHGMHHGSHHNHDVPMGGHHDIHRGHQSHHGSNHHTREIDMGVGEIYHGGHQIHHSHSNMDTSDF